MSCIKDIVVAEPLVDVVAPEQVVTNYSTIMTINTQTCTKEDLAFEVRTPSSHTHTHTHARARACVRFRSDENLLKATGWGWGGWHPRSFNDNLLLYIFADKCLI